MGFIPLRTMKFLKRKGLVKLPTDPRGASLKRWCMEVQTTLQQLRDSGVDVPTSTPARPTPHPFRLRVARESSQNRLYVYDGAVNVPQVTADADGNLVPWFYPQTVVMSDGSSLLEGASSTPGYEVLSTSTDYGIWLEYDSRNFAESLPSNGSGTGGVADTADGWYDEMIWAGCGTAGGYAGVKVIASSTAKTPASAATLIGASTVKSYAYIGYVSIDGSDVADVLQTLKTDYQVPFWTMPSDFVKSTDADNVLSIGADGRLTLSDTGVVTSITAGTGLTLAAPATGVGDVTINNDNP